MKLVLVVEDEYGTAEVLQLLLETAGYRVAFAPNGKVALELLAQEKPSLILSDFMMPHMTGGELGLAIRANPEYQDIPIVLQSGTNEAIVQRTFADYDAFIAKPMEMDRLLETVDKLAEGGRPKPQPRDPQVDESVRQLLKGLGIPPKG